MDSREWVKPYCEWMAEVGALKPGAESGFHAGFEAGRLAALHSAGTGRAAAEEMRAKIRRLEEVVAEERFKSQQLSDAFWNSSAGDDALRDIGISEAEIAAPAPSRPNPQEARVPNRLTGRERACLEFLSPLMDATAEMIGGAVQHNGGNSKRGRVTVGHRVADGLWQRKPALVAFVSSRLGYAITAAGRDALNRSASEEVGS